MKRLTSLDFIRGILVLGMTLAHVVLLNVNVRIPPISSLTPIQLMLGAIFINFTHWRGFFIMVSGLVSFFSLLSQLERGTSRERILIRQLLSGFIMIILGKLYVTFFFFWGMIDEWTRMNGWSWELWTMFYYVDTIEILGWITIVAAFIFYLLTIKNGQKRWMLNAGILIGMVIMLFLLIPVVQKFIISIAGVDLREKFFYDKFGYAFDHGVKEKIIRVFLNALIGVSSPLFPMLGVYLMGSAIAVVVKNPEPKRRQLRFFYVPCVLMIAFSGYETFFMIGYTHLDVFFDVFPRWYSFFSVGTHGMIIIVFLIYIEFNPRIKQKRWLKGTKYIRRFGIFALTVYWFQLLEAIPRTLFMLVFGIDTTMRFNLSLTWSLLLMGTTLAMWSGILFILDKGFQGIGSLEWIILQIRSINSTIKRRKCARLDITGKLDTVEMIQFQKTTDPE